MPQGRGLSGDPDAPQGRRIAAQVSRDFGHIFEVGVRADPARGREPHEEHFSACSILTAWRKVWSVQWARTPSVRTS